KRRTKEAAEAPSERLERASDEAAEAGSQGAAPEDQIVAAPDRDDFRAALAVFEGLKDGDIQRVARHVGLASAFLGLKGGTKKARLEALARVLPRATRSARGERERQRINDLIQREIADLRRNLEENAAAVA